MKFKEVELSASFVIKLVATLFLLPIAIALMAVTVLIAQLPHEVIIQILEMFAKK